jgi:hypothetical protein
MFEATSRVDGGLGLCAARCLVFGGAGRGAALTMFTLSRACACALRRLRQLDDSSARRLRRCFTTPSSVERQDNFVRPDLFHREDFVASKGY